MSTVCLKSSTEKATCEVLRYAFALIGEAPLMPICNNIELANEIEVWRKNPVNQAVPGDDRSPPWGWMNRLYLDHEGFLTMPSQSLMACLRVAGAQIKLNDRKTFKEICQSGILIEEEFLTLLISGKRVNMSELQQLKPLPLYVQLAAVQAFGLHLQVRAIRLGRSHHARRVRAICDKWMLTGELSVLSEQLGPEALKEVFERAGRIGLGDWRPGGLAAGPYGRFTSELTKLTKL